MSGIGFSPALASSLGPAAAQQLRSQNASTYLPLRQTHRPSWRCVTAATKIGRHGALFSRYTANEGAGGASQRGFGKIPSGPRRPLLQPLGALQTLDSAASPSPPPATSPGRRAPKGRKRSGKAASPKGPEVLTECRFDDVGLAALAERRDGQYKVSLQLDSPRSLVLHWAVDDWVPAAPAARPPGTTQVDDKACQTAFGPEGRLEISFAEDAAPTRVVFVLKQLEEGGGETWFNNGGGNYAVQLRAAPLESFVDKVLAAEGTNTHWSLPQRLMLATEVLESADAAGPPGMSLVFTWLRLSSTRVLDWYRGANFQPKDVASMLRHAGERIADKARCATDPLNRLFARGALAGLPRGGGNGDDIRMGILHIMRGNGIREGHRPGHDEPFLEQWHQKLHTNTSPDDVTICEAYLAFLHSGNHDDYWRVLWDNGRLTREKMASWTKPIKAWPHHLPHLIPAFQGYLWTLKTTHSGADLDTAMEMAKGHMDDDLRWKLYDILSHRHEWWVPGKIVEARERLAGYWKAPGSSRDLLLLDIALENWFRTCLERTSPSSLGRDDLLELVGLVLRSAQITHDDHEDLSQCRDLWERLRPHPGLGLGPLPGDRWSREWALGALAAAERLQLSVAAHMDTLYGLVQPHAEAFGSACRLDPAHVVNFGEEVVRGQPLFLAAQLLAALEPQLRQAAGGAPWQIVSQGSPGSAPVAGEVVAVRSLEEVQGAAFERPTVLLAGGLTGVEDIPAGVVAVLTRSSTDVLSHLAIRARSQRVLLATCFDEGAWREWQDLAGTRAAAAVDPAVGAVMPADAPVEAAAGAADAAATGTSTVPRVTLAVPERTSAWAVGEAAFCPGLVGAKALNLAELRRRLAAGGGGAAGEEEEAIGVPASVALPYGTFERVLGEEPQNAEAAAAVERLVAAAAAVAAQGGSLPRSELEELRRVVAEDLIPPLDLVRQLAAVATEQGLIPSPDPWVRQAEEEAAAAAAEDEDEDGAPASSTSSSASSSEAQSPSSDWSAVWSAVCRVWASKWTDRAWLSRRALGIREEDLFMSVLLQQVVPFEYSFVLHTSNPVTHTPGELLGEVVVGMGETLVGNYPGRALGFTVPPPPPAGAGGQQEAAEPRVLSLPSKRVALFSPCSSSPACGPTLIARSDANAEDLEQYAAAGLYDSVTLQPLVSRGPDYSRDPLLSDPGVRGSLLRRLAGLGRTVAAAFGGRDQDVEGGVRGGRVYVVQARPQVELHSHK